MAFGVYIHVPFCSVRCGYCDFNTYAPGELGGATPDGYVAAALGEMAFARSTSAAVGAVPVADTVFFGGGTPTMLDPSALARLLDGVRDSWGIAAGAEVSTEANPDSVTERSIEALAEAGFTRVSFGMQSAVPHVLATLDRTHHPENVARAVAWARAVGLAVSVDLIYGTPGESLVDWHTSVEAAVALEPDHVSAYALVIEPGTKMGAQLRRGEIAATDPDTQADMYEYADATFEKAGFGWYEVSNWALSADAACRHNMGYWRGDDWWGIGPGAHSYRGPHEGGKAERWWNVKHPTAYADRIAAGLGPELDRETLDDQQIHTEAILLGIRLREGLNVALLDPGAQVRVPNLVADGLVSPDEARAGRLVLTRRGRLLADAVVRDLVS